MHLSSIEHKLLDCDIALDNTIASRHTTLYFNTHNHIVGISNNLHDVMNNEEY